MTVSLTHSLRTLFIYFDESGNFDFSTRGSAHYILTAFCTFDPVASQNTLRSLAHELACDGLGQESFHAAEDKQHIRDQVFALLPLLQEPPRFHISIARKKKVPPALRESDLEFYNYLVSRALRHIIAGPQFADVEKLIVIFSKIFNKKSDGAMTGAAKSELKKILDIPYWVYSHAAASESNCQIADYCCWATFIKHERGEERSHRLLSSFLASEQHLFPENGVDYY